MKTILASMKMFLLFYIIARRGNNRNKILFREYYTLRKKIKHLNWNKEWMRWVFQSPQKGERDVLKSKKNWNIKEKLWSAKRLIKMCTTVANEYYTAKYTNIWWYIWHRMENVNKIRWSSLTFSFRFYWNWMEFGILIFCVQCRVLLSTVAIFQVNNKNNATRTQMVLFIFSLNASQQCLQIRQMFVQINRWFLIVSAKKFFH